MTATRPSSILTLAFVTVAAVLFAVAASPILAMAMCANGCGAWRRNDAASAIGGSASCCSERAST